MEGPRLASGDPSDHAAGDPSSSVPMVTVTEAGGGPDARAGGGAQTMCRLAEVPGPRERPPAWPAVLIFDKVSADHTVSDQHSRAKRVLCS